MNRLAAASQEIRGAVPDELVPLFWAITLLGSAKFLVAGLLLVYWNDRDHRPELLALVSVAVAAMALTVALKYWFHLPRPPAAVQRYPVEPSPVAFPSGHAITATTVYGGALVVFDRYRDPAAVAGVGVLVAAISLSRVVVGVHYLGDVIAGVAVGVVAVVVLAIALERGPVAVFALAAVLSVPGVVVAEANAASALTLGGSLGGLAMAVRGVDASAVTARAFDARRERVAASAVGLAAVGTAVVLAYFGWVPFVVLAPLSAALVATAVALPTLAARFTLPGTASDA